MAWLVFGLAAAGGVFLILRGLVGLDPRMAMKVLLWLVVAGGAGLIALLTIRGGLGHIMAALLFLLPLILRWRQTRQYFSNLRGPRAGSNSGVETRYLRMTLDHDSGVLDGTVLTGEFRGKRLGEMSLEEQLSLLAECRINDDESATVLEAYLDRIHGPSWRSGDDGHQSGGPAAGDSGPMTRAEALDILGLSEGASADDIIRAHRKMMKEHHPDQGGSNWFATKLNQAKDILLNK